MNFMLADLGGALLAICLFPVFLILPGLFLARRLDFLECRNRTIPYQLALGLVLSVSITPILTYLLSRFISIQFTVLLFVVISVITLFSITRSAVRYSPIRAHTLAQSRSKYWISFMIVVWVTATLMLLCDVQMGNRVYPSVVAHDYAWRIAVTGAISRDGIPAVNPSFYPGHPFLLHYYYFWFMTCSLVDLLGGQWVEPRTALIAGTFWVGVALMAVLSLYIKVFMPSTPPHSNRRWMVAMLLLLVSGLDILPLAIKYGYHLVTSETAILYPSIESWNEQITAWPTAVLWVPHHVAALVATLTVLVVMREFPEEKPRHQWIGMILVGALGLASAVGLSVWMTLAFALFWIAWMVLSLLKGWHSEVWRGVAIGCLAVGFALPYLVDLHRAGLTDVAPVAFSVRPFTPIQHLFAHYPRTILNLMVLPFNYFIELGFFAIAGIYYWRRRRKLRPLTRNETALVVLAICATMVATFLRSNIGNNDLGWRSIMFVQFVLLLWSADFIHRVREESAERISTGSRILLVTTATLGVLPFLYDAVMMKVYPMSGDLQLPVQHVRGFFDEENVGRRYYDLREAYYWMNTALPERAIVQHNPVTYLDLPYGLYGNRRVIVADQLYGTHGAMFGIPVEIFSPVYENIASLFVADKQINESVTQQCHRYGISALMVRKSDPIWLHQQSGLSEKTVLFANTSTRIVACN